MSGLLGQLAVFKSVGMVSLQRFVPCGSLGFHAVMGVQPAAAAISGITLLLSPPGI